MGLGEIIGNADSAGTWLAHRRAAREIRKLTGAELKHSLRCAFVGSFTLDPLVDYLVVEAARAGIRVDTHCGQPGAFAQELLDPASPLYSFAPDVAVLLWEPEAVDPRLAEAPAQAAAAQVADAIAGLCRAFQSHCEASLLLANVPAPPAWPFDLAQADGTRLRQQINARIGELCSPASRLQLFDVDGLASYLGYREALSSQLAALAQIPFSQAFLSALARKLSVHLRVRLGLVRKCLVLDCDNTLWGGVVGEDGLDGIQLGPDSPGREFVGFQRAILELHERGVLLAINSKNNPEDVAQVLQSHPHMLLREPHFASIRANWQDKPRNMLEIAAELNLGVDSFVFVDDQPSEREMMRQLLPEVATLELPRNPSLYERALRESGSFGQPALTDEDRRRGRLYADERQRQQLRVGSETIEGFLHSLGLRVSLRLAQPDDVERIAQLTQRTNQFNLTTRRYDAAAIEAMRSSRKWRVWVLKVTDRFGDHGKVGVAILETDGSDWRLDSLLMSCRVIGKQIEEAFAARVLQDAKAQGAARVTAEYRPTAKNALAAGFLPALGFRSAASGDDAARFELALAGFEASFPAHISFED